MNSSIHRLSLDVAEAASRCAVTLRQGENAHRLEMSLTDNGLPYHISEECYAVFAAKKSDGTQILNDCSIVNDTVIYDLTAQTTAAPGKLSCEVRLYGETNKLIIAPKFSLFVEDSAIDEESIESSDEFSAFNALISQAVSVAAFRLKGYFDTVGELADISAPAAGDAYGIGTDSPYEIYVWDAVNREWVDHGTLQGDAGEPGQPGAPGAQGPQGVSGVYVGSGTAPESYNVQIDPNGSADELVTEAPKDNKQYARKNGEWAEVAGGGGSSDELWRPTVDSSGNISWEKSTSGTPPATQNIKGQQGIQGPQGPAGSDAEVTAANIAAALGYTPADEDDLNSKLNKSGGDVSGNFNFTANTFALMHKTDYVLYCSDNAVVLGDNSRTRTFTIAGNGARPGYRGPDSVLHYVAFTTDIRNVKTTMDAVATVNTQYFLGTQSAVSIVLPSGASAGDQIMAVWYNGTTAATLTIQGSSGAPVLDPGYSPSANSRSEINALWDGSYWAVVTNEQKVSA